MEWTADGRAFKPGRGLSTDERTELTRRLAAVEAWLDQVVSADNIEQVLMPVLTTMASRDSGGHADHKALAYLIALQGLPLNALIDVVYRTLGGLIPEFDPHWAPNSAELAKATRAEAGHLRHLATLTRELLEARELPPPAVRTRPVLVAHAGGNDAPQAAVAAAEGPARPPRDGRHAERVTAELAERRAARAAEASPAAPDEAG